MKNYVIKFYFFTVFAKNADFLVLKCKSKLYCMYTRSSFVIEFESILLFTDSVTVFSLTICRNLSEFLAWCGRPGTGCFTEIA